MSFDWIDYLNLAKELAGQPTNPSTQDSKLRSAISRAYYAVFCKARNYLRDNKPEVQITNTGTDHIIVWKWFRSQTEIPLKKIGEAGRRLKKDRRKADYDDTIPNLSSLSEKGMIVATQIFSTFKKL